MNVIMLADNGDEGSEIERRQDDHLPPSAASHEPIYATVTGYRDHDRRPIIPAYLRNPTERRTLVRHMGGRVIHRTGFHAVRSPWHGIRVAGYVSRGAHRLVRGYTGWAFDAEHKAVRAEAVRTLNMPEARAQYRQRKDRVRWRGWVYWVSVGSFCGTVAAGWFLLPAAAKWLACGLVALVLAYVGRPKDRPAFTPAVVRSQYRKLTSDMVESALMSAGLAKLDKEGRHSLVWVQPPQRDGAGYLAVIDLPPGTTFAQALDARAQIASGLHCSSEQVWPERDRSSERRLRLWVGDQPMSEVEVPAWPLLKGGTVDLFRGFPFGLNARGRVADVALMFSNVLVGAIPRMGKSFAARLIALACALDPTAELHIVDLKGGGDWLCFEPVAHSLIVGDQPADLETLTYDVRGISKEMSRRYLVLRQLAQANDPRTPEGKITAEIVKDKALRMHPIVLAIDEIQVAFAKSCEYRDELEALITDLIKRGPAVGVILIVATQKPDKDSLPTGIRDNVGTRFGMRVLTQQASDMVLGGGMSVAGYRAHAFTRADIGVGYLVGANPTVDAEIVRSYFIDGPRAERVIARARVLRENVGTVTGYAAGVSPVRRSSLLEDVLTVMIGDRQHCEPLAALLATAYPDQYAGWNASRLGGALRGQGVHVRQVKVSGVGGVMGVQRSEIERIVAGRDTA